jgi:histidinol dehydrogenase
MSPSVALATIDCRQAAGQAAVARIRQKLSPRGEVVSTQGRQRTLDVFGEALSPRQVVERICRDVEVGGLSALLDYGQKLDRSGVSGQTIRVAAEQMQESHAAADPAFLSAVRHVRDNVLRFQQAILHRDVWVNDADSQLGMIYRPLDRVGCCVPGGAAAYPSTLLMTVVPAQAAGVRQIAVMAPPTPFGADNRDVQAVCWELGVRELYRMGGAQGVAALAYGVEGIPSVDKIVGPGNLFVALAKQLVSDRVGIDMMAGPTEVVLLADESASADLVAADLISQAEHAPGASILITWSEDLVRAVPAALERQLARVDRSQLARESLEAYGAVLLVADESAGCRLSDELAPEHLSIQTSDPDRTLKQLKHAGAIFVGPWSPVAVGDYIAGPSHTLPTGGTARFASGLSANDFLKRSSIIRYTRAKLQEVADSVRAMAAKEGLTAHSHSVDVRFE